MAEMTLKEKIVAALMRLVRFGVGQIPFIVTVLQGNPDPKLVALGALLNAIAKFLRDVFPFLQNVPI